MKPVAREEFFDELIQLFSTLNQSNQSLICLIKGNPGTGKTYTTQLAFPNAFYLNCKLSLETPKLIKNRVIILDEVDQFIQSNIVEFQIFIQKIMAKKQKSFLILICNDITNKIQKTLQFKLDHIFNIQDYTQPQLKAILQASTTQPETTGMNILVKKIIQENHGDCRILNGKLSLVHDDFSIKNVLQINNLKNLHLEGIEAFVVKSLYELKENQPMEIKKIKNQVYVGFSLDSIWDQIQQLGIEIEDSMIIQQFLEKLQCKKIVKINQGLYDLDVSGLQVYVQQMVREMTL